MADEKEYRVRVRNTFLDIEEDEDSVPGKPDFSRAQTEPGREPPQQSSPSREAGVPDPVLEDEEEDEDDVDAPPPPPPLCRWVTQDVFESLNDWQWPQDQPPVEMPSTPTSPLPSTPPPEAQFYGPMGYAPVGFIPVPVVPVQYAPPTMMADGHSRGMRWPMEGGQPAQPFQTRVNHAGIPLDIERLDQIQESAAEAMRNPGVAPAEIDAAAVPKMPGLERHVSVTSGIQRISFTLPEKKLRASDKVAVSPSFPIFGATWRLMVNPYITHANKGGSSFKTAKGWASISLKCEDRPEELSSLIIWFRFFVADKARGPGQHDFTQKNIATLSQNNFWDLISEVKQGTVTVGCEMWQAG